MKKLTIMMAISVVFFTSVLLIIGFNIKEKNKKYYELQNDMIEASQMYVQTNIINLFVGETAQIKAEKMIEDKMIKTLNINDDICTGYVTIKRTYDGYNYKPYIKCKNYETISN